MVRFAEEICNFLSTISLLLAMIGHRDRLRSKRNHFASMLEMLPSIVVVELATSYLSLNLSLVLKCCELYPTLYRVQIEIRRSIFIHQITYFMPIENILCHKSCFFPFDFNSFFPNRNDVSFYSCKVYVINPFH